MNFKAHAVIATLSTVLLVPACSFKPEARALGPHTSTKVAGVDAGDASQADTGPSSPTTVNPHWVLYDGNGKPVKAIVAPVYYDSISKYAAPASVNPVHLPASAVKVTALGNEVFSATYSLPDGKWMPINAGGAYGLMGPLYINPNCSGDPYAAAPGKVIDLDGQYLIASGPRRHTDIYYSDGPNTQCRKVGSPNGQDSGYDIWPMKPLPASILHALPNPPYSIRAAY